MKRRLRDYVATPALYQSAGGPQAQVGDQVRLFLDTEANPGFPESIVAEILSPITPIDCQARTSYLLEYDDADLDGAAAYIRPDDVVDAVVITQLSILAEELAAETDARIAADADLQVQIDQGTGVAPLVLSSPPVDAGRSVTGDLTFSGNPVVFPPMIPAPPQNGKPAWSDDGNYPGGEYQLRYTGSRWALSVQDTSAEWAADFGNEDFPEEVTVWAAQPPAAGTPVIVIDPNIGTPGVLGQHAIVNSAGVYLCTRETPVKWVQLSN